MALMKSTCQEGDESNENYQDTDKISREIFSLLERNWLLESCHAENSKYAEPSKRVCILSIDGGGMRGILACCYLLYLQNALKIKTGDANASISDYFDIAAGTNIGGIIVAALFAKGENGGALYTAQETMDFILEKGKHMFQLQSRPRGLLGRVIRRIKAAAALKCSSKSLARILQGLFSRSDGQPLTLRDTLKPILVPCYDLCSASPFLFSEASARYTQNYNFNIWEVCRATMSSPGFEKPNPIKSVDGQTTIVGIDGGLVMNNPTAAAITHVMNNKAEFPSVKGVDDILVLSLGTGALDYPYKFQQVKRWGILEWAKPIMNIVTAGVSDIVDHAVSVVFHHNPQNYVRLQATRKLSGGASEGHVKALMELAEETLKEKSTESMNIPFGWRKRVSQSNADRLDWFAEQLAMEHRSRAATEMIQ